MYLSSVKDLWASLKFRQLAPQRFGHGSEALRPLFRWSNGQAQVQNILQKAAVACGLPQGRFMSRSLRVGGASALFQPSGEIEVVKRTGRWSSSAVQRYLHGGEVALKDIANKMGERGPEGALHLRAVYHWSTQVLVGSVLSFELFVAERGSLVTFPTFGVQRAPFKMIGPI